MHQVGLVGAGYIADIHLYWLRRLPGVEVVGIADVDGDRATAFARRHGIARVRGTRLPRTTLSGWNGPAAVYESGSVDTRAGDDWF